MTCACPHCTTCSRLREAEASAARLEESVREFRDLLRPLSPEEYAAAPVPSREQIRAALRKGRDDLRDAARHPRRRPGGGRRYR